MSTKRVAVISVKPETGEKGGAERFYQGLVESLNRDDIRADLIEVTSDESGFDAIKRTYLRFYDLDLSNYFGVISTKAPAYLVRHPNHISYLQHTMRVFYDMFDREFPHPNEDLLRQRELILALDTAALKAPRTKEIFVIGKEVQQRLLEYNGLHSKVLYQASTLNGFYSNKFDYIFLPGRLHRWKRVDLIIKAMHYVSSPVRLLISGDGEDKKYFQELACKDARVSFLGKVSDQELIDLYANALVVPFVPVREDFGLVTLEAFLSGKPVITCNDSGEPANIIEDGQTGFICTALPEEIAKRLDYLFQNPAVAHKIGEAGRKWAQSVNWENVSETLIKSLGG